MVAFFISVSEIISARHNLFRNFFPVLNNFLRQHFRNNAKALRLSNCPRKTIFKKLKQIIMTMLTVKPETGRVHAPRFDNLLENIFENEFPTFLGNEFLKHTAPLANVQETKDAYTIEVSAPGFSKESFNVKVEDSILTITGEAKEEKLEEGTKFTRKEFVHASFKRSFTLPKTIVAAQIAATYQNGILKVTLPKMEEAKAKGTIEVKIS